MFSQTIDDRQFVDAGEVERFVKIAPAAGPLSEEGNGDVVILFSF
ncbi:MAG: hypothetical protein MPW15_14105 [Candidatus Manganitrophus sp.]|nr:hypothetical protein [Candidatus Manganitrophus sp.]